MNNHYTAVARKIINRLAEAAQERAEEECQKDTHEDRASAFSPVKETVMVDSTTGGRKGSKLARFDLIPPEPVWALAIHYGVGCLKYDDRNWEKGYKWGLSVAALQRHLNLWLQGESYDAETRSHHLTAVVWHAFALLTFELRGLGTDDVHGDKPMTPPRDPDAYTSKAHRWYQAGQDGC